MTNARIADLIRESRAEEISDAVAEGQFFDMQTFQQALIEHVLAGVVEREVAANAATNSHDFLIALEYADKVQRHEAAQEAAALEEERAAAAAAAEAAVEAAAEAAAQAPPTPPPPAVPIQAETTTGEEPLLRVVRPTGT